MELHECAFIEFEVILARPLSEEIDSLIRQGSSCDKEEDASYKDNTGYQLPVDLKFKY